MKRLLNENSFISVTKQLKVIVTQVFIIKVSILVPISEAYSMCGGCVPSMEFSLNVSTEFSEFSDKKN